ncbi:hypothetical protein M9H77_16575 [Catharanthus roseus]|uniref:Uncharacterized protein n=1 Tax=Catharanthus roseus TaxID=4058 RepID=A0ACC0B261_CATRO|nr:hypothetical protein M9H77_16575 [Catharanthus roseus]
MDWASLKEDWFKFVRDCLHCLYEAIQVEGRRSAFCYVSGAAGCSFFVSRQTEVVAAIAAAHRCLLLLSVAACHRRNWIVLSATSGKLLELFPSSLLLTFSIATVGEDSGTFSRRRGRKYRTTKKKNLFCNRLVYSSVISSSGSVIVNRKVLTVNRVSGSSDPYNSFLLRTTTFQLP